MKKSLKIVLIIILVLAISVMLLILLRTPSGYSSGTTCPYYTQDCSCFGIEKNDFNGLDGGRINTYCYGVYLSNCKCYENSCPVGSGTKKEIPCTP